MRIFEGNLQFLFDDRYSVIKFDETAFYRRYFNGLPGSKGVDIIADSPRRFLLIEIKNCNGHEAHNRWRTNINSKKIVNYEVEDSFDIEIAKKVAMSIPCLVGAYTKSRTCEVSDELLPYSKAMNDSKIIEGTKKIKVIFFLEGDFATQTRSKKMIMKNIQDSLRSKLSWLYCDMQVVDSTTVRPEYFEIG